MSVLMPPHVGAAIRIKELDRAAHPLQPWVDCQPYVKEPSAQPRAQAGQLGCGKARLCFPAIVVRVGIETKCGELAAARMTVGARLPHALQEGVVSIGHGFRRRRSNCYERRMRIGRSILVGVEVYTDGVICVRHVHICVRDAHAGA